MRRVDDCGIYTFLKGGCIHIEHSRQLDAQFLSCSGYIVIVVEVSRIRKKIAIYGNVSWRGLFAGTVENIPFWSEQLDYCTVQ